MALNEPDYFTMHALSSVSFFAEKNSSHTQLRLSGDSVSIDLGPESIITT